MYVMNNPLVLMVPTGSFSLRRAIIGASLAAGPAVGAVVGATVHVVATPWKNITWGSKNDNVNL